MAQQKRLPRNEKITLGKMTQEWRMCKHHSPDGMATLFARGLLERDTDSPGAAPNGKYRLTVTGLAAKQKGASA